MFDSLFPKHWTTLQRLMWLKTNALARAVYETITGNPVTFTSLAAPLRKLQIAFSPVQEGSGDPSPDNVRPISGWSSLGVTIANQNVVSESFNKALGQSEGSYVVTNTAGTSLLFRCVAGTTYYLLRGDGGNRKIWGFFKDKPAVLDFVDAPTVDAWSAVAPLTGWGMVYLKNAWDETLANASQVSITEESTVVPPVTRSISISLGSTYYSGWVDAVTGQGEVTMASVDIGTLTWTKGGTSGAHWRFSAPTPTPAPKAPAVSAVANALCSVYRAVTANQTWTGAATGIAFNSDGKILIADENYADETALTTALTGQTLVYELATPIPIQLTPQEINSLAGDNTMFTSCDSLTVEYRSN